MVGLIRTYSNHRDRADLLRRTRLWLREDQERPDQDPQASVRANPNAVVPRRVVDRLGEAVVQEIIQARQAGAKLTDVAKQYGISESTVKRISAGHAKRDGRAS